MASMIQSGENGLKYEEPDLLVEHVKAMDDNSDLVEKLGQGAYQSYLDNYTEEKGYENLLNLYPEALKSPKDS